MQVLDLRAIDMWIQTGSMTLPILPSDVLPRFSRAYISRTTKTLSNNRVWPCGGHQWVATATSREDLVRLEAHECSQISRLVVVDEEQKWGNCRTPVL